eukprot:1720563-Prymnesium_polylepis.1
MAHGHAVRHGLVRRVRAISISAERCTIGKLGPSVPARPLPVARTALDVHTLPNREVFCLDPQATLAENAKAGLAALGGRPRLHLARATLPSRCGNALCGMSNIPACDEIYNLDTSGNRCSQLHWTST